eukprot:scaffold1290_cov115-Isochrysis_galbana.AAC.4
MKEAVRVLTVIWSRGISSAPSAYSSGRGKHSRRGPLNPLPHLASSGGGRGGWVNVVGGRGRLRVRRLYIVSSPRLRATPDGGNGLPFFGWLKRDYGRVAVMGIPNGHASVGGSLEGWCRVVRMETSGAYSSASSPLTAAMAPLTVEQIMTTLTPALRRSATTQPA